MPAKRRLELGVAALLVGCAAMAPVTAGAQAPLEEEAKGVKERLDRRVALARQYVELNASDSFAGLYVDTSDERLLHVGFVTNAEEHAQSLRQRLPSPSRLQVFTAERTLPELERLQSAADADLRELEAAADADIQMTNIDVENNRVVVTASGDTAALADQLTQRYGEGLSVEQGAAKLAVRRSVQSPPLHGGLEMHWNQLFRTTLCTSGFVTRNSMGNYFMMSSGHCGPYNTHWYQGVHNLAFGLANGPYIGRVVGNSFYSGSWADANIVAMDAAKRSPSIYANGNYRIISNYETSDYLGEPVCKSGITSEYTCGTLRYANATIDYGGTVLFHQRIADMYARSGDSGGPVFYFGTAIGVVSGITCADSACNRVTGTIYSHIVHAQQAMGVRVYTR